MSVHEFRTSQRVRAVNQPPSGGDGGGNEPMEARVKGLETTCTHIQTDIGELKSDIREIRGELRQLHRENVRLILLGVGAIGFLLAVFVAGYYKLSEQNERIADRLTQVQVGVERLNGYLAGERHGT